MNVLTEEAVWQALDDVKDPEIPVVSLVEMGIVRDVVVDGDTVTVTMTPTFSGCPALRVMEQDITAKMAELGFASVSVQTVLAPPWSSDWITDEAREKLQAFGLAPPMRHNGRIEITFYAPVVCPYCGSEDTAVKNQFGPTLCRAIYYCNHCQQPFEQFKAL
ncbi:MAG TPA: phenylacetate-CoA oxygenase subunit PaaJ [Anaerolineae bacterium]|nr:phenylacetate-CoA oxygenase subunit PaaJ [Anaerolineae bacterium]